MTGFFDALLVLFLCCWAFSASAAGAGRYIVDVWTTDTEPALPESVVIALTQTRDGYLWLGTYNGLARFDGIRFASFDESNTPGLESGPIVYLFEDSHTNLWLGTHAGGIVLIKGGRVIPLPIGSRTHEGRLVAACEDSAGTVWLYTFDGQLFRYRAGNIEVCHINALGETSKSRTMIAEKSGFVWVGTDSHIFGFDPKSASATNSSLADVIAITNHLDLLVAGREGGYWRLAGGRIEKWSNNHMEKDFGRYPWNRDFFKISSACEDRDGNLVVGTYGNGAWMIDAQASAPPQQVFGDKGLKTNDTVLSMCVDREGTLWVGTDGDGLNRVKRPIFNVVPESLNLTAQSVCPDGQGGILFGKFGGGIALWKNGLVQQLAASQELTLTSHPLPDVVQVIRRPAVNLGIRSVFADDTQQIWAGADEAGLLQFKNDQFVRAPGAEHINSHISAIFQDRKHRLWMGTQAGLVLWNNIAPKIYTTNLTSPVVRALADDSAGNLWIGTDGGGLNCLHDDTFTSIRKGSGLPSDHVTALFVDKDDVLWIGTASGLARFHDGKWASYTTEQGLSGNGIAYITEDANGYLWIGSNAGLMRVPKKALNDFAFGVTNSIECRSFGKADGLPTRECAQDSQPAVCRATDGTLWFATIRGLVYVNPSEVRQNTNPPPVVIESALVDYQRQTNNDFRGQLPSKIVIPPDAKQLEIQYSSLNLSAPDKTRFKYRMAEDASTVWTDAGNSRVARYPKLAPGEYHFEVTACNEDGVWNETGARLAVTVLPPFWRKPWFIGLMTVYLLGLVAAIVHYFSTQRLQRQLEGMRQQQALEKERSRIARDIHDQLGASLTQVSLLGEMVESDKNIPEEVEAHARQISQTARDTSRALDEIVWTVNPSNDTVEGLVNYICKYAQEYLAVAGLRYRFDVPSELPATEISPEVRHNVFLAAKESVTNVVRHAKATEVSLRLHFSANSFTIEIQDNGRGPGDLQGKQSRNGLRNMHKRMEDVGGSFALIAAPGGGALVRLTVPVGKH